MDAGVLQLHVFADDPNYEPMRVTGDEKITPSLFPDQPHSKTADVSLIIPTCFNPTQKADVLVRQLEGMQDCKCIKEVVIVAADGDTEQLERFREVIAPTPLVICECEPNKRSQSRNVGTDAASHDMLLYLDDDMLLQDWRIIDVILHEMLTGSFDCALFPRRHYALFPLLYQPTELDGVIEKWKTGSTDFPEDVLLDPVHQGSPFKSMAFCFPGCFMLIHREAFDRAGRFPDGFVGWGFEDTDFAMRAVRRLKVLNLFRSSPPLLHIDHPVSPYKNEEYRRNLKQFSMEYQSHDMDWLCRSVFHGEDFIEESETRIAESYLDPLAKVLDRHAIPVPRRETLRGFQHAVDNRLQRGLDPIPSQILLHGSRGSDRHDETSDYDVLALFRGGGYSEHYVIDGDEARLELECAGLAKFEYISAAPVARTSSGPLELAKLVQAKVLWGDADDFCAWRSKLIRIAVEVGFPVWLLYGIGLRYTGKASPVSVDRYFDAVAKIIQSPWAVVNPSAKRSSHPETVAAVIEGESGRTGAKTFGEETVDSDPIERADFDATIFSADRLPDLIRFTRELMDRDLRGWREDMSDSKRVFAIQVPEIWYALNQLLQQEVE